ncbi:MAG: hypothetical protein FWF44_11200, partial [Defluviitaleaceae bacterium]|nr:hypothetical protein [Defluviitaleaceae bacterium]
IHYSSDGAGSYMSFRQTYTYDASGSLVKMDSYTRGVLLRTETTYGPDGAVSGTTQYTYDDSGNLVKTSGYDANNNLVEEDDYDARGAVAARWAYAYDAQGNKIKASSYQGEDRLISETSYDASGAVTQRVEYRYDGGGAHTYMLTYDAAGRLTEEFDYNVPAGSLTPDRWAYTYDDAGNFLYKEGMLAAASWDWSEKTVTLSSYYSYPVVLAQPIPNCVGFTLDYEMHDISYGNPYGKQNIYIKTDAGSWKKVGSINVPDDNTATAAVTLSDPTGVAAVAVIPSTAKNTSWTCWFNPYNFIIRSTEPFTETVFTA